MPHTNLDLNWIFGTSEDDNMTDTKGSDTSDVFIGFGGNDKFVGFGGDDYVFGGCGDDIIFDYSGNNFINAGWGNDTVVVGDGNSVIAGDCGSDTFVMTNRLAIGVPDQPVSSNDIEVKAEILDFNICRDKLVFDVGLDTNDDGIRDTFLDSADDLILSYNDFGWAVFSSDEFNVEVTLKGIDSGYMNYIEHYNINIFDFA